MSSCPVTRRRFAATLCGAPWSSALLAQDFASMPWNEPAVVARVYLVSPTPHWPKPTLDVKAEVAEIEQRLAEVGRKHSRLVKLIGGDVLHSDADVKPWLARMGDVDGVLIVPVTQPVVALNALANELTAPAVFFSRPYATHAWSSIASMQKAGKKIDVVASSSYGDLDPYMRAFRTVRHLRKSRVIVGAASPTGRQAQTDAMSKYFGTSFRYMTGNEFKDAFNAADARQAEKVADDFTRGALRVLDVSRKEILDGVRFYLALQNLLQQEKANAITIDCFGTLKANTLPGYPCIAWSKFNDAGLYGVCEADISSTMTQILVTGHTGMPGFVSDPVFDTSRNEVIHAHCVAATRMKGPNAPASPYIIRNHLETNEGAVVQVLMPSSETITVARFTGPREMLISNATVTGAVDTDRGCRSQIRTRVADAEAWLRNYRAGLHRVIFYGDHTRDIQLLGRLMGFQVAREA
jgi:hypothetical protein